MKNHVQQGKKMPWTNNTGVAVSSGDPVLVGSKVGVATGDIAAGASGILQMDEVFSLPKANGAITHGQALYWDADGNPQGGESGAGCLTTTSTDNTYAGYAFAAAAETAETVNCKLMG